MCVLIENCEVLYKLLLTLFHIILRLLSVKYQFMSIPIHGVPCQGTAQRGPGAERAREGGHMILPKLLSPSQIAHQSSGGTLSLLDQQGDG